MEPEILNFAPRSKIQNQLKNLQNLFSELVAVTNNINILHESIGNESANLNMMEILKPNTNAQNQVMGVELPSNISFDDRRLQLILNEEVSPNNVVNYLYYLFDDVDATSDELTELTSVNVDITMEQERTTPTTNVISEDAVPNVADLMENLITSKEQPTANQIVESSVIDIMPHRGIDDDITLTCNLEPSQVESEEEFSECETLESTENKHIAKFNIEIKRHQGCDDNNMFVPTSDGSAKKLCCVYCLKRYQKLERHLRTVHKNETEVKEFLTFPPRTKERRYAIDRIRKKGQFEWNTNSKINGGELSTSRRQNKKFKKNAWDYKTCANCKGTYSSNMLRHHWNKCTNDSIKGERVVKELGRAVEGRLHPDASDDLIKLFAKFRDDEGIRMVRFDWLVVAYGNDLCLNYSPYYQEGYICLKLRATAKVLRLSKSISSEISDFSSLYRVQNCNTVVEAIRKMAKFDPQSKLFGSPGTASTTVTLINTIGELLIVETMKLDNSEKERNVERFLKVFKKDVRTKINKLVAITKAKLRRRKKENIPTTGDVNKLATFLDSERDKCFFHLTQKYSYQNWLKLSQVTLVSALLFNRRRAGEMRNITLTDFHDREMIAAQGDTIPEKTRQLIKSRMKISGKLDRTVPVLLKHSLDDCIEILIRHRKDAGIPDSNEFLFALPSQLDRIKTINVWTVIQSFATACGAQNPSSLRGTNLRKHMASFCATINLNDNDVTNLADFMGHDDKIHRAIYRNNPLSSQVSQMTSLLDAAQGINSNNTSATKAKLSKATHVINSSDFDSESSSDSALEFSDNESEETKTSRTRKTIRNRKRNQVQKLSYSEPRGNKMNSTSTKKKVAVKGTREKRKNREAPKISKKRKVLE